MSVNIDALLHLQSISFAVGLAYIALDPFRYSDRGKKKYDDCTASIQTAAAGVRDSALTRLRRERSKISSEGLGCGFFWGNKKTFGFGDKSGWDCYVVNIFLILLFVSLCISSVWPRLDDPYVFWTILSLAITGTLTPVVLSHYGKKELSRIDLIINEILVDISSEHGIPISTIRPNGN